MSETTLQATADQNTETHPAFEFVRRHRIDSLNVNFEEYRHRATGAVHYHLGSDSAENVFTVAFRTVPEDSTGVAHILEHTALCGSEKYPVRDPFFLMIRRSLNTFMNAMTSSDWTAYPFASVNRKDFQNLLQIYLDAVFFSRLDPLDFAQEGHRVEFSEPDNPDSELTFKGVVFNEMKGAMSSINSLLWQKMCEHLFPTTTYHYNSGGEPANIPDLTYEQLKAFYQTHYHPSNAIFMTFGDIPAAEHQAQFETLALSRFEALDVNIQVPPEQRYDAPKKVTEQYCIGADEDASEKTHVVMGWLLGESTDLDQVLEASLLASVLLDNSAAPLRHALETTELGQSPSPLCGLEDSMHELVFVCGLEGCAADATEQVEQLVLDTLTRVEREGIPESDIEAMLHQLELQQREVGGDGYPYGLQLVMATLGVATHRGDPLGVLDIDPAIEQLREKIKDPDYIKRLLRALLTDNPHRVTLTVVPDAELAARQEAAEKARLTQIKAELDSAAAQDIVSRARALQARQEAEEDESILPKVSLADVADDKPELAFDEQSAGQLPVTRYARGTNGIAYQQIIVDLPQLNDDETSLLRFYTSMLSEAGFGDNDYIAAQRQQAAICGGLGAYTAIRARPQDEQDIIGKLVISTRGLNRNHAAMTRLLRETFETVRFDEHARLRELIAQARASSESRITGNGHVLAMNAACSGMSPVAQLQHDASGLAGVARLKTLDKELESADAVADLAQRIAQLHQRILQAPRQALLVGEQQLLDSMLADISSGWQDWQPAAAGDTFKPAPLREARQQFWVCNTQVNFCARAFPTVPAGHADAPALAVLGGFLRNGYLHRAIREQGGAYGGGAGHDSSIGAFRFFSYRDPRLEETLDDFDRSIEWLLGSQHDDEQLEQAILGVIGGLDKPGSPAGEAKQDFHDRLFDRAPAHKRAFRSAVLAVSLADLQRVAQTYLQTDKGSTAVISNSGGRDSAQALIDSRNMEVLQC